MSNDLDMFNGKQVDCVQSILHRGSYLAGFTIRFTDGSLLKVDAGDSGIIEAKFVNSKEFPAIYDPDHLNPSKGGNRASDDYWSES